MSDRRESMRKKPDLAHKQNRSDAVMAQRGIATEDLDDFPTPPWGTRAFIQKVIRIKPGETAVEPAAGRGYMSEVLKEGFAHVDSFDIEDYGYCPALPGGFLENIRFSAPDQWDWCITNPPFKLAAEFIERGLHVARRGVAMLCRTVIIEGQARYDHVYTRTTPSLVAQYVERVPMVEAQFDPKASTATGYCWLVWDKEAPPTSTYPNDLLQAPLCWIPPCRAELERPWERVNALLIVAKNEQDKADQIRFGTRQGTTADAQKHADKSRARFASACKELRALRVSQEWETVRPLLRDVDGTRLANSRINVLLGALNA